MKKAGFIVMVLVAAFCFLSCAHLSQQASSSPAAGTVLDRVVKRGELVVGMTGNMPPLNMTTKEGEIIGLEPDLANAMAVEMGVKLRLEIMPFSELLNALESGKVDLVMSSMTMTPERNLKFAFVGPYYVSGKAFLTRIDTIAKARDTDVVNSPNTTLAVLKGSTSERFVKNVIPRANRIATVDHDQAVQAVIKGEAQAMVADFTFCVVSAAKNPGQGLLPLVAPLTYEPIGIALPPNDPLLTNWVQNFLSAAQGSGDLAKLKLYWFGQDEWLDRLP